MCNMCAFLQTSRGREMERRRTEREREIELDTRDRLKEKEELEELKSKILAEGHSDPSATLQQVINLSKRGSLFKLMVVL